MTFWVTDFTSNGVSVSNRFFTYTATWGQGSVYSDKETFNMLLWIFRVFGFKLFYIILMPYHLFKNKQYFTKCLELRRLQFSETNTFNVYFESHIQQSSANKVIIWLFWSTFTEEL